MDNFGRYNLLGYNQGWIGGRSAYGVQMRAEVSSYVWVGERYPFGDIQQSNVEGDATLWSVRSGWAKNYDRYNWLPYNRIGEVKRVPFAVGMVATVQGVVGAGKRMELEDTVSAQVIPLVRLILGLPVRWGLEGHIRCQAAVTVRWCFLDAEQGEASAFVHLGKTIPVGECQGSDVDGGVILGKTIPFTARTADGVQAPYLYLGKTIPFAGFSAGSLLAWVSTVILDKEVAEIKASIPPGGLLVIDGEHFNVFLNDQNILHLHAGDWITLDRETIEIAVTSGSGGRLEGKIVYREAYL